jgi:multisubunit Na+/H+ antiporter MnhB subunit
MSFFFNSTVADAYITVLPYGRASSVRRRLLAAIVFFVLCFCMGLLFGGDFAAGVSLVYMGACCGSVVSVVTACCFTSLFTSWLVGAGAVGMGLVGFPPWSGGIGCASSVSGSEFL